MQHHDDGDGEIVGDFERCTGCRRIRPGGECVLYADPDAGLTAVYCADCRGSA
jgi:hypothetical protein